MTGIIQQQWKVAGSRLTIRFELERITDEALGLMQELTETVEGHQEKNEGSDTP